MNLLHDILFDYTLRTVVLGSVALGITSGALGAFAVLRRQSLLGDAISHAALPGIACAYLLTGSKAPWILILGAATAGWLAAVKVMTIVRTTRIKTDTALGLVLSVFFGVGMVLLTIIQRRPDANQAGLDKFLFGQAAALMERDVVTMGLLGGVAIVLLALFWKEFKLLSFDPDYGAIAGFPMRALDILLTSLVVIAIVIGLQTVGVVLMSAMIVAPAAAARQWTDRLSVLVILAALFGALAGVSGSILSSLMARLPTGPTIVLCMTAIVLVSLLAAPNRGLLWNWARQRRSRRRLQIESVLTDLYRLAIQHEEPTRVAHATAVLRAMGIHPGIAGSLHALAARGWARETGRDRWSLTAEGMETAGRLLKAAETGADMNEKGQQS
jgi:manganese/zinc/iron transport system permease protein